MPRNPARRRPPITFAHRGASANAPENTLEAFALALRLGASGLESDVWLTADGIPVLDHDGVVRRGVRKVPIARLDRAELPAHIPTVGELYDACGTGYELALDIKDPAAALPTLAAARAADAAHRLWLVHPDLDLLVEWRSPASDARLVHSTRVDRGPGGTERHAARLADVGVDAVNLHHSQWSGGLCAMYHRFERDTFGWDAQHERVLAELVDLGIDGVFSDHVSRMTDVVTAAYPA
jgi:glycerophosphoryl diester phosphodiesterase